MIEIDGATLRVSAGYSLKVPTNVPYSMEDAHFSFSIEQPLEDEASLEAVIEQARELSAALETGVKLQTFTALDVAFEDADGTLRPVITVPDVPTAAPKAAPFKAGGGRPASGNKGGDRPEIQADLGFGTITYLDNRPLKTSGQFKSTAADFRSKDKLAANGDRFHSVWVTDKNGNLNAEVAGALSSAGVSV